MERPERRPTCMPTPDDAASKADLHDLEERMLDRIGKLEERMLERNEKLEGRMLERNEKLEERLLQRIEKVETNMLTAFRMWARRSDARQKTTTVLVNSFDERLGNLEDEVADIRDKLKP